MPINKRKKSTRFRAHTTHGWGAMKKRRGSGNRGGRGMAGSGKMAGQNRPSILKEFGTTYFGKRGFNRPQKMIKKLKIINLNEIEKIAQIENLSTFDASKYDKVLGKGKLTKKIKVISKSFSEKAKAKIAEASGEAEVCH